MTKYVPFKISCQFYIRVANTCFEGLQEELRGGGDLKEKASVQLECK